MSRPGLAIIITHKAGILNKKESSQLRSAAMAMVLAV
jgi:hypothetical protein